MIRPIFILILLLLISPAGAEHAKTPKQPKKPLAVVMPLLQPIRNDAMTLGKGPIDVYVFVDPKCPRSQEFVAFIAESDKMRRRYRYHFYLYELPRFHSGGIINAIYAASSPLKTMIGYMTQSLKLVPKKASGMTAAKIARIEAVAQNIGVYKRPYLILNKPQKSARKK